MKNSSVDVVAPSHSTNTPSRGTLGPTMKAPETPVKKKKKRIGRSKVLRPLVWYFVTKRGKQVEDEDEVGGVATTNDFSDDDAASPMSTARISDEEDLSSMGGSGYHHFLNVPSDEISVLTGGDGKTDNKDETTHADQPAPSDDDHKDHQMHSIQIQMGWRQRVRRSLGRMVRKGGRRHRQPLSSFDCRSSSHADHSLPSLAFPEDDSTIFSTSTDRKRMMVAGSHRQISTLELAEQVECCLNQSTSSADEGTGTKASSLSKYIEQQSMIQLADVSTQDDAMSVGSASLAVSFDGNYPQLFLQPSTTMPEETDDDDDDDDDYHEENEGGARGDSMGTHMSFLNRKLDINQARGRGTSGAQAPKQDDAQHRLGASYAHPAQRQQRGAILSSAFFWKQHQERRRQRNNNKPVSGVPCCFDEEQVWNRIDASASHRESSEQCDERRPSPVPIETQLTDWDNNEQNEDMRWSFSNEDSVVSFSSLLGDTGKVFQPVVCRFDDLPAPCGDNKPMREPATHEHPYDEY